MADVYSEGLRLYFVQSRKDLSKKKTVNVRFVIGFERMIRKAVENFRAMGLEPVIYRAAPGVRPVGYCGGIPNKQFAYDHRRTRPFSWMEIITREDWASCGRPMRRTKSWRLCLQVRPARRSSAVSLLLRWTKRVPAISPSGSRSLRWNIRTIWPSFGTATSTVRRPALPCSAFRHRR